MKRYLLGGAVALAMMAPTVAYAQLSWDSPMLLPPNPADDYGIYLMDVNDGGVGVLGTWRSSGYNFGLRGGIAEENGGGVGIFGGIDYNGTVNRATTEFPLDIDWIFGAGLGFGGDGIRISAPLGLTGGHSFTGDGATFTPFISPRVVLDAFLDSDRDEGLGLDFAVDLGLDLRMNGNAGPLAGTTIRFGGTIGNRSGIALGLVF